VVTIPCSTAFNAIEDALLSLALVALVGGNLPEISWEQVVDHIICVYNFDVGRFSMSTNAPKDFLVHFRHRENLEVMLTAPTPWPI